MWAANQTATRRYARLVLTSACSVHYRRLIQSWLITSRSNVKGSSESPVRGRIRDDSQSSRRSLKHLENEGLTRTSLLSSDDRAVSLTDRGRDLLEANRYERDDRIHQPRQTFYAGVRKPRELTHDTNVYRAYQRAGARLRGQGGRGSRVVLDYEVKRDYQRFLHERNRGKKDRDGRPDREPEEIARWALR